MLLLKNSSTAAVPALGLLALLALACCAGCGSKDSSETPAPAAGGSPSIPPQAQAQERADAAFRSAHAPH